MKCKLPMLLLICVLIATQAVAKDTPTITRIDNPIIRAYGSTVVGDHIVGNLNQPAWSVADWFWGDEEYKYLFDPTVQLDCPSGFLLETVHMLVEFEESMVPVTFGAWVDLEDAMWNPQTGCWAPGIEDCVSDVYSITIEEPGTYDIALPLGCLCAYMTDPRGMPYMYMLSMHFVGLFDMNLLVDDMPTPCTVYNNWGEGWYDLYNELYNYGNLIMYGDVVCCDEPLSSEGKAWGEIKSLYR